MSRTIRFGRFEVRTCERILTDGGHAVMVGARAFDILVALLDRSERVVSRNELIDLVWPGLAVEENNLSVHICALRRALGQNAIVTVPGRGYQFAIPLDSDTRAATAPSAPEASPPLCAGSPSRPTNLPDLLPPLYGRADEVRDVQALLREHALVTITGAGGIGKTRLAQEVAHGLVGAFAHGVWMVELAALTDPSLLVPTIAQSLRMALPSDGTPTEALLGALKHREVLILLDNCEHLVGAVSELAQDVLGHAGGVRILATSQELLRVPGEHLYRLAPLAVPTHCSADRVQEYGAVRLFLERVRALDPAFRITDANVEGVVAICSRLDGIALALELAAARVPMYGVEVLQERLIERFRILTTGPRVALPRHQTLRAALDWSHALLSEQEQKVFRRLSPFVGGFTIEAAQQVAADESMDKWAVVDHLSALIDKSLVLVDDGVRPRYSMLETARAYALERARLAQEQDSLQELHAQATLALLQSAAKRRDTGLLVQEMGNLRRAYQWAVASESHGQIAVAIATGSSVLLAVEGFVVEALERLITVGPLVNADTPAEVAARYWQWLGRCGMDGRLPVHRCLEALRRAERMFREQGNLRHQHACLRMQAQALLEAEDLPSARRALEEARHMEAQPLPVADRLRRLRCMALLEDRCDAPDSSLQLAQDALTLAESAGIERYVLILLSDIAGLHLKLGHAQEAVKRYAALAERARLRHDSGLTLCYALAGLTAALVADGQLPAARGVALEAVPLLRRSGLFTARADIFAWLLAREGQLQAAARLAGAADAFRRKRGSARSAVEQHIRREVEKLLMAEHGAEEVQRWSAAGAAFSEDVLAASVTACLSPDADAA